VSFAEQGGRWTRASTRPSLYFTITATFGIGCNAIGAFWFAYIVTRPLGASLADWLGRARRLGGLGLGTGPVSLCLALVIAGVVVYLSVTHADTRGAPGVG